VRGRLGRPSQGRYFLEFSGLLDTGTRRRHLLSATNRRTK
jgi:hypothetical protein